ncbi:DUF664 domain-containing protein [Streptomyces curacoi]|uniref:Mini-circle protein n=1 Tax=Streptomyces curacoi TaxID=146536 RepID=A0A117PI66_9ACTN|nr:DUF664 domain-containing protein [Streptomyces curacoi]KUM80078.1 hypothetical protein AQI70_07855 [Streptomyces curacoi]
MGSAEHASEPSVTRWTRSTVFPDMWVDPDDDPRETDVELVDERSTLLDALRHYRLTLEMKCAGLDAEQMARRSVPPSTMSLLGLVRHMVEEERHFRRVMAGAVADAAVVADAWRQWRAAVEHTDRYLADVTDLGTSNAGFSDLGPEPGGQLQLRDALLAHIGEYARHCGHADLLRERVDGRVGQ